MLETPDRIEPCFLENPGADIIDVSIRLRETASTLGKQLHPRTSASLAAVVRIMNTYYTNLIEGHATRPKEIERVLRDRISEQDPHRDLLKEAESHMRIQALIEEQYDAGTLGDPASPAFILWLHREFYRDATDTLLTVSGGGHRFQMVPGAFRSLPEHDVAVGVHTPPSSPRIAAFMEHFYHRYSFDKLKNSPSQMLQALAAAHHRLAYIHPFPDGNGRVCRLMSHAMALKAGIGCYGLWAISRGLARGLTAKTDYKMMLMATDQPRQGDYDGRGNLSEKALRAFVVWFLQVCLDQVGFMDSLFDLKNLQSRFAHYVKGHPDWKPEAVHILNYLLRDGDMPRGEASRITGLSERSARDTLKHLLDAGIIRSETPKSPVFLHFSMDHVEILFPNLSPA